VLRTELCIGCGVCAKACPRSAISIFEDAVRKVVFQPEKCGNCSFECNAVCPTKALEGKPTAVELTFEFATCASCGKRLSLVKPEAEYLAERLADLGEDPEIAFLCENCKRNRLFDVANKYEAYLG